MYADFTRRSLDADHDLWAGRLPEALRFDSDEFDALWRLHPTDYHEIQMRGRAVKTPRWQQAYGKDYHYTGRVNSALPAPPILAPLHQWCREVIDDRLNGLLLNWYDGRLGHYIGKHRDSTKGMLAGAPVVTVSYGEARTFRLRPWKERGFIDFEARDGTVFIMPYETNLSWTHEVPTSRHYEGRRISVTLRGFEER